MFSYLCLRKYLFYVFIFTVDFAKAMRLRFIFLISTITGQQLLRFVQVIVLLLVQLYSV